MWLFLIRIPSCRSRRWLMPPPQQTAYLSSARRPGMVLRVSRILVLDFTAATARTYSLVSVAMPDMRCIRFRMTRSVERMAAALARMTAMAWPFLTRTPSKISGWETTSKRPTGRVDIFANSACTAEMQPMPATTHGSLATTMPVARCAGSMVSAVVMSLAALSSSRAASRSAVMRRLFQSMEGFYRPASQRVSRSARRSGTKMRRLVGGGVLGVVDDDDVDGAGGGLELQSNLFEW